MDGLQIERASIVGSSMGASTALTVALRAPERVSRLVLRSPPPFPPDDAKSCRKLATLASAYRWLGVSVTARVTARTFPVPVRVPGANSQNSDRLALVQPAPAGGSMMRFSVTMVGRDGMQGAWLLTQHADTDLAFQVPVSPRVAARRTTVKFAIADPQTFG
jgi:pimeloyl-ACP methyl ester carboxylesterase